MKQLNKKIGMGIISSIFVSTIGAGIVVANAQEETIVPGETEIVSTEKIGYNTRYVEDYTLPLGVEVKVKDGERGEKQTVRTNEVYRLGNELNYTAVDETKVITPASDKVIRVGKAITNISGIDEKVQETENQKKIEIAATKESERLKNLEQQRLAQERLLALGSSAISQETQVTGSSSLPTSAGVNLSRESNGTMTSPAENREFLATIVSGEELKCADTVVMKESGYRTDATNPSSGAYGVAQSLPASKYSTHGSDWQTNGKTQILWMHDYVKGRYGSFCNALEFHKVNNWY